MEISRLFFSKETQEKLNKPISPQHKGKLRWEKLKEAESNGTLQHAKRRVDLGKIVGIEDYQSAYSWVTGLIKKGAIKETIAGFENNYPVYEYTLGEPLEYRHGKKRTTTFAETATATTTAKKKKNKNTLSLRERGQIRWEEFMKRVENGDLEKCKSRRDVAMLAGYESRDKGYSWITNMISRGHLIEERLGYREDGSMVCKYKIGTHPNFNLKYWKTERSKHIEQKLKEAESAVKELSQGETLDVAPNTTPTISSVVTITYGELKIELKDLSSEEMKDIINNLIDKVKE